MRRVLFLLLTLPFVASPATAHPHILIDAKTEIIISGNKITAIRHSWTMDEAFTKQSLQEQEIHTPPTPAEIEALKLNYRRSVGDFSYFTFVRTDNGRIPVLPGADEISLEGGRLRYSLTTTLSMPLPDLKSVAIDLFDPNYYVAVTYKSAPVVTSTDASCRTKFRQRPPVDPQTAARFADNPMMRARLPTNLAQIAQTYANRLTLSCSARKEN